MVVVWLEVMPVYEEQLVKLIARGDRAAFEELYRRTSPWLMVRLRRRCADDELVAEVMQETYLAVWRAADSFAGVATGAARLGGCGRSRPAAWSTRFAGGPAPRSRRRRCCRSNSARGRG